MDSPELPQPIKRHEAPKNDIKNGGAHKQAYKKSGDKSTPLLYKKQKS